MSGIPMHPIRLPGRRALVLAGSVAAVGVAALGLAGPAPGEAASPFVAGQAATQRTPVAGRPAADLQIRAGADGRALGLPVGARRDVQLVTDRFLGVTYTEVTERDAKANPVSLTRYGGDGRLLAAIRFGWRAHSAAALPSAGAAIGRASALIRQVGLAQSGPGTATRGADDDWAVVWSRSVDGVPVAGDGVRVTLFADGSLHAIARSERPLAARPATTLSQDVAKVRAGARLDAWLKPSDRDHATLADVSLTWVAPNDMFAPAGPDAPAAILRLAWVVTVHADGPLANRFQALQMYLDAGDGRLLGGDVLR